MLTQSEKKLICNYMIGNKDMGGLDASSTAGMLLEMKGEDIISVILEKRNDLREIVTNEIPQFSNEKDLYIIMKVLIESGLSDLTYYMLGTYLCPVDAKYQAKRKYGENHYKFAQQLGLTVPGRKLAATDIGVAYYCLKTERERQSLISRLVFSIPIVQHAIVKASECRYKMPEYLAQFLAPSTVIRRRSNMHKIMGWAYDITDGKQKEIFDNIIWY